MTITRTFKLCLNAGTGSAPYINVNQYDSGEQWLFELYQEDGTRYTPSTGAIIGLKADGHAIMNNGTVDSEGRVVITETEQMTAAAGRSVFELSIDGLTHGTANFIVKAERKPLDEGAMSDSDISMLQEVIDASEVINEIIGEGGDPSQRITDAVDDWLDAHPEATTTVEDGAITIAKLNDEVKTGVFEEMSVGNVFSDDSYTEDKTPYLYRVSGGGVEVGKIEADKIVGGTVAWNQQVQNGNFASTSGWAPTRGSGSVSNNMYSYTVTELGGGGLQNRIVHSMSVPANHKALITFDVYATKAFNVLSALGGSSTVEFNMSDAITANAWNRLAKIGVNTANTTEVRIGFPSNYASMAVNDVIQVRNVNVVDLTQMFGTAIADYLYSLEQATAGAGVAWFKKLFPKPYYAYDAGTLKHVEGLTSHDMTGFNQWDEEWINGIWDSIGKYTPDLDKASIACKNKIKVFPNTKYYFTLPPYISRLIVRTYDANDTFLSTVFVSGSGAFTSQENCGYITFCTYVADHISSYTGGLCINISHSGYRDGEYEPYKKHSYALDSSLVLRGIPKLDSANNLYYDGDVYSADGKVTRKYGIITYDGSTDEAWHIQSAGSTTFYIENSDLKKGPNYSGEIICDKLKTMQSHGYMTDDYIISGYNDVNNQYLNQNWIYVRVNSSITEISTFKTWLQSNPITVVYELATPTEETAEPYAEYQHVTNGGTEQYVSTGIVPVGHNTFYPVDIVGKVNKLPSDFSTLIAPTETGFKATRNYTAKQFLIINNTLYKVTANIASGGTITPNSNVTAVTIADILTTLI